MGFKPTKADGSFTKLGKNVASGGLAGAMSLCFVYSLDYARTRLANDTKSAKKGGGGERQFNGLFDVYKKTVASDGVAGFGKFKQLYINLKEGGKQEEKAAVAPVEVAVVPVAVVEAPAEVTEAAPAEAEAGAGEGDRAE